MVFENVSKPFNYLNYEVSRAFEQIIKFCSAINLNSLKSEISKIENSSYLLIDDLKSKLNDLVQLQATCNFQIFHDINEEYAKISKWINK